MPWAAACSRQRECEREMIPEIKNVTIAVPPRKKMPHPTMAAAVNVPTSTVMAIQMKPAMKPASRALMMLARLERSNDTDMPAL